jgi:hypothetical protein
MYFSVSDSSDFDVNPYNDLPTFLNAKVKKLTWGKDKKAGKEKFCRKFMQVLYLYDIVIPEQIILSSLNQEEKLNKEILQGWVENSTFPARK